MKNRKCKFWALALSLVLGISLLAGCGTTGTDAPQEPDDSQQGEASAVNREIVIGQSGSLCQAALLMAYEKGYLADAGFDVTFLKGDYPTLRDGLAAGTVDVTDGLLMSWIKPVESGLDLAFTTGVHTGCLAALAPIDSGINGFADLKGKTIGVSGGIGGVPMSFAYRAIYKDGLDVNDFQWRDYPAPQLITALENGEVDAVVTTEQVSFRWIDDNQVKLFRSSSSDDDFKGEYCCLLTFRGELSREDPELVADFTNAVIKASEWVAQNKEETVEILLEKEYVLGDKEYNLRLLEGYNYIPDIDGAKETLEIAVSEFKATGILNETTDVSELVERVFFDIRKQ